MVWNNEIGKYIPATWNTNFLGQISEMYQPKTLSKKDLSHNGKFFVYGANGIIGKYYDFNHKKSEIVISCRGTCGIVNRTLPKSWITGNAMVVRLVNPNIENEYLYQMLKHVKISDVITGSVQPQITRSNLEKIQIIQPSDDIILKYCYIIRNTVILRIANQFENQELSTLRDFLLPLLMNGQVTLMD